jgi:hypothetical protein
VLGVLPILWNAIRSFWIRRHLASLIPAKARKNTSLIIDPAAGVVIVILDDLELRWRDVLSGACQQRSLAAREVGRVDHQLGGCSWMGLYQANVPLVRTPGRSQRVVVDASLRFEPRGIRCDRQTLLFLALGLGVDPYCNQLHRILEGMEGANFALTDTDGRQIMSISTATAHSSAVQLCSGLSFSERRALAWFSVMVMRDAQGLLYMPLASVKVSRNVNFTIPPGVKVMREGLQRLDQGDLGLELALTWTCYAESVFYDEGNQELLPVPQTVLKTREGALAELKSLPNNELGAHLSIIFSGNTRLIDKIGAILKQAWLRSVPVIKDGKRKGQKRGHIEDCQTYVNLNRFLPTCAVLRELYNAVKPCTDNQRNQHSPFDDPSSPMVTAARIWLGLSIIQLWQREEWESQLSLDGLEEAKPNSEVLRAILIDSKDGLQHQVIYVG